MTAAEEWRPVVGFEALYEVSSLGRVRSSVDRKGTYAGKLCGQHLYSGYFGVVLSVDGKKSTRLVHCLVAAAFIGPVPDGKEVGHKDHHPLNNAADNLEYVTHLENMHHSLRHGRRPKGTAVRQAKLDEAKVRTIREQHAAGRSAPSLAEEHGVTPTNIRYIVNRVWWKHVA